MYKNTKNEKEDLKNIWGGSILEDISRLESNNVGVVGETFLDKICEETDIESSIDGSKTKQIGGGIGDGEIKNKSNEVKTARQGNGNSKSFQHELGNILGKQNL